jgi:regulation of enolase protein 1 (concanavalin A-like superfamily)
MDFHWLNKSELKTDGNVISIYAPEASDFFCNNGAVSEEGITPDSLCNAPFYYTDVTGDFVLDVKVSHDFKDTYDSASIMVMEDNDNWAKSCFEKTDFDTHAAVSVVTKNGASDDANGCNITGNTVWLRICRVNNSYSFLYSENGINYYMTRFFNLSGKETVKVGLLAQAPQGKGGIRIYENLSIVPKTVKNIRAGI